MKWLYRKWSWIARAVRFRRAQRGARWVEPANAITQAIATGGVGELPALRTDYRHRPVALDDYPALAGALREFEAQAVRPREPAKRANPAPVVAGPAGCESSAE